MDNQLASEKPRPPIKRSWFPWFLFLCASAVAAFALWQSYAPKERPNVLATTLHAFEKQNRLIVFSAQLSPVVTSDQSSLMGLINARQVAVIPAHVDYALDLSKVGADRMLWDEANRRLTVSLPPLEISKPNLHEANAQYLNEGIWISRTTQDALTRENTLAAEKQAVQQAANPVLLDLARSSARDTIRQNLTIPLEIAGYENVTVIVRFDGEKEAR